MAQWSTTYSGLIAILGEYVEDDSTEFTSNVQGCVNRAEERIFRDLDLQIWNTSTTSSTSDGVGSFVKSFAASPVNEIWFSAAAEHAERRSLAFVRAYGGSGRPIYFHEDATTVTWAPTPDATYAYTLTYIERPTPLSASNTTNWFATHVADLLLYASLVESEKFLIAPERVQEFEQSYQQMLGPVRAFWRQQGQLMYEPISPTPSPQQTR